MTKPAEIDTVIDCIDRGGGREGGGGGGGGGEERERGGRGRRILFLLHGWGDGCILLLFLLFILLLLSPFLPIRWIAIPRHRSHPSSLQSNPHGSTLSPSIEFLTSGAASAAFSSSRQSRADNRTPFICFYSSHRHASTLIY